MQLVALRHGGLGKRDLRYIERVWRLLDESRGDVPPAVGGCTRLESSCDPQLETARLQPLSLPLDPS
jgi:hypothetical protein